METYYLSNATGTVHRKWINHPYLFAGVLFFYALLICISAWILGIWSNFGPNKEYIGFCSPNWGMLYPIALPIVALCTSFFLRVCSSAIKSLDSIILHKKNDKICFSHVILERIKKGWRIIFLISMITSLLIVALADGSDIIEPFLKSSSSHHKDWTTHGYTLAQNLSYAYLLFNIFAFSMEAFLSYCGITLLLGASTMIYWVIAKLSILEISRKDKMKKHEKKYINDQIAQSFKIQWDWDGQNGRCGLHEFDKVYGTYVACIVRKRSIDPIFTRG